MGFWCIGYRNARMPKRSQTMIPFMQKAYVHTLKPWQVNEGSLVSVRRVLESYESVVIQGWWPDSRRVTDVDEQEPRALRPQQVAIRERFDRRRMEAGRTFDPTWQARRRQADGDHA